MDDRIYEVVFLAGNGFREFTRINAPTLEDALKAFRCLFGGPPVYSVTIVTNALPGWSESNGHSSPFRKI